MDVKEIISLMALMGVGLDEPTPTDQDIFLKYLNLAHYELYRITAASLIRFIGENSSYQFDETGKILNLPSFYFSLDEFEYNGTPLIFKDINVIKREFSDNSLTSSGQPLHWYYKYGGDVFLYPVFGTPSEVNVTVIPNVKKFTILTTSEEIPYPEPYVTSLIHGALYYVFQSESGFKNIEKMKSEEAKWNQEKTLLLEYLQKFQSDPTSTYSN